MGVVVPIAAKVYLDNAAMNNVIEADDVEGYVVVLEFGDQPGTWRRRRLLGDVRIEEIKKGEAHESLRSAPEIPLD